MKIGDKIQVKGLSTNTPRTIVGFLSNGDVIYEISDPYPRPVFVRAAEVTVIVPKKKGWIVIYRSDISGVVYPAAHICASKEEAVKAASEWSSTAVVDIIEIKYKGE